MQLIVTQHLRSQKKKERKKIKTKTKPENHIVCVCARTGLMKRVFALRSCCLRRRRKVICLSDTPRWGLLATSLFISLFFFVISGNQHFIFRNPYWQIFYTMGDLASARRYYAQALVRVSMCRGQMVRAV